MASSTDLHGSGAWAPARSFTCQQCGAPFESRNPAGAKWCPNCRVERERVRRNKRRDQTGGRDA